MGSGAALAAGRTFGLTNTTVDRTSTVEVVDDPQALLGIDGLSGCDDEQLTLTNNVGEELTVTVSTSVIDVTSPGAGKTTTFPLGPGQQQVVEFEPDTNARDDVRFEASTGTGEQIDLTRSVTLTPVDPAVYQLEAKHSGLVMGVQNGGTEIRQYDANGQGVQPDWTFHLNDDCTYRIENVEAGGVVSVQNPNNQGSPLVRETWDGNDWQRWTVLPNNDGTYRVRNRFSGQVIDVNVASTSEGATVLQWPWKDENNDNNQSWNFTRTGTIGGGGNGYVQWSANGTYSEGDRVVHEGTVYEAKWGSSGREPGSGLLNPWQALDSTGDGPTYPQWSATEVYPVGDRVVHDGSVWELQDFLSQDEEPGKSNGTWTLVQ